DRFLVLLPLYHINSTTFSLASLVAGASIAAVPGYSNSKFWQQLAKTQATFTSIVPTICYDQLSKKEEFEAVKSQLKVVKIQIGSAPVVPHDSQKFVEQFGIPLYQGYGQTETALRVTGVPLDLEKELYANLLCENSIGKPMNWAGVEIMDAEGNILKEGQEGELAVKGKAVMAGYMQNEEATSGAFKNGYFLTGDIGYYKVIDTVRYFFLKGRSKEIIIKGGVNLSPVAIESKLKGINNDIDQVYVVGFKDERYGEEVGAVVCWKENHKTIQELETQLKYQLTSPIETIVPFEVPKYIKSIKAENLPMTSTGKVQRSVIKATIPQNDFEKTAVFAKNETHEFLRLTGEDKPLLKEALQLYNYCWQPLLLDEKTFLEQAQNGVILIALNQKGKIEGMITFLRTSMSEEQLKNTSYRELTDNFTLKNNKKDGNKIICVSICSVSYQPLAEVPSKEDVIMPSKEQMTEYLASEKDLTYNFHKKPKGGILGAELVSLIEQGRPEDLLSLGYNMLMKYPSLSGKEFATPDSKASVAVQLIEATMFVAKNLGAQELYVFSRPAGAFQYFSKQ
ncbi:MAG: AMP-binding protein, partial [bacterium]|nr:AMP-binding protein [bacterium]